jgi:hypothetical protein
MRCQQADDVWRHWERVPHQQMCYDSMCGGPLNDVYVPVASCVNIREASGTLVQFVGCQHQNLQQRCMLLCARTLVSHQQPHAAMIKVQHDKFAHTGNVDFPCCASSSLCQHVDRQGSSHLENVQIAHQLEHGTLAARHGTQKHLSGFRVACSAAHQHTLLVCNRLICQLQHALLCALSLSSMMQSCSACAFSSAVRDWLVTCLHTRTLISVCRATAHT